MINHDILGSHAFWFWSVILYLILGVAVGVILHTPMIAEGERYTSRAVFLNTKSWIEVAICFMEVRRDESKTLFWICFLSCWAFWPFARYVVWWIWFTHRRWGVKGY